MGTGFGWGGWRGLWVWVDWWGLGMGFMDLEYSGCGVVGFWGLGLGFWDLVKCGLWVLIILFFRVWCGVMMVFGVWCGVGWLCFWIV